MNAATNVLAFPMHRVRQRAPDEFPLGWPTGHVGEEMDKLARLTMTWAQSRGSEISLTACRAVIYTVVCEARHGR